MPASLLNTLAVFFRWQVQVTAFTYWMTEAYPPFVSG